MKKFFVLIFLFFIMACNSAVEQSKKIANDNKTEVKNDFKDAAIIIDDKPYYFKDLLNFIYFNFPETRDSDISNDNLTHIYINEFINFKLLVEDAKKNGVKIDKERFNKILEKVKKLDEDSYVIDLPINFDDYKTLLKESMLMKEWINKLIEKNISVSEEEVKKKYEEFVKNFKPVMRYHVLQIVTLNYKDAARARRELLRGKKFAEVAKKYSVGPEKDNGGDLGYIVLDEMPKVFFHIKKLRIKRISPIYKSEYGYHIFKVLDKKKDDKPSYEVLKPRIYQELYAKKVDEFLTNYIKELRKNAEIKINFNNIHFVESDNKSGNN